MMRMNAMPMRAVTAVPTACILHSALTAGSTGPGIPIILSAAGLWLGGGECPRVLDPPTNSSASRASALRSPSPAGENAEPQAGACFRRTTSSRPRSRRASTTQVRGPCVFPHALLAPPPRHGTPDRFENGSLCRAGREHSPAAISACSRPRRRDRAGPRSVGAAGAQPWPGGTGEAAGDTTQCWVGTPSARVTSAGQARRYANAGVQRQCPQLACSRKWQQRGERLRSEQRNQRQCLSRGQVR
jgi:hypothetical protein